MRILVLSDLHLESRRPYAPPAGVAFDVVILAGDIHRPGIAAIEWAAKMFRCPVVFVAGNHEYYGSELHGQLAAMKAAAAGTHVHFLHRDVAEIDGVTFIGCTLWTDFAVPIGNEAEPISYFEESDVELALRESNNRLSDFTSITLADPSIPRHHGEDVKIRGLRAEDELAMHWLDRSWLQRQVALTSARTVVVTHHAPHRRSIAPRYRSDWVTPAFVSDLPKEFFSGTPSYVLGQQQRGGPILWVHGHTHVGFDYTVDGCRIVANPRGYFMADGSWENHGFNAGLVVEV